MILGLALVSGALVHAGHGESQWFGSLLHYLMEPVHLPIVLGVSALLVLGSSRAAIALQQRTAHARRR